MNRPIIKQHFDDVISNLHKKTTLGSRSSSEMGFPTDIDNKHENEARTFNVKDIC
jgi:hypothetical protein